MPPSATPKHTVPCRRHPCRHLRAQTGPAKPRVWLCGSHPPLTACHCPSVPLWTRTHHHPPRGTGPIPPVALTRRCVSRGAPTNASPPTPHGQPPTRRRCRPNMAVPPAAAATAANIAASRLTSGATSQVPRPPLSLCPPPRPAPAVLATQLCSQTGHPADDPHHKTVIKGSP